MTTFADRLQYAMGSAQMRQVDLVKKTGLTKSSISMYLSGLHEPSYEAMAKMAIALRVPIDFLRHGDIPEAALEPMQEVRKMNVRAAARCLGKSEQFVRMGLQRGLLPIGAAVPGTGGRWSYYISPYRLRVFVGADVYDSFFKRREVITSGAHE